MTVPGPVQVIPLRTGVIEPGEDLIERLVKAWREAGTEPAEGDVLVLASKVVALWEGSLRELGSVVPSQKAVLLATTYDLPAEFVEIVLQEADKVLGGVKGALLTVKDGIFVANAGADLSNSPPETALLWPRDSWTAARHISGHLAAMGAEGVAVVIADSHVQPLRMGTTGFALGWHGLAGVEDLRGKKDLYGRQMVVTRRNVADMVSSAASLLMGESDEAVPAVLLRGLAARTPEGGEQGPDDVLIAPEECLFEPVYRGHLLDDGSE
jgi:coenzyme F420-0:L-glutamate ligase